MTPNSPNRSANHGPHNSATSSRPGQPPRPSTGSGSQPWGKFQPRSAVITARLGTADRRQCRRPSFPSGTVLKRAVSARLAGPTREASFQGEAGGRRWADPARKPLYPERSPGLRNLEKLGASVSPPLPTPWHGNPAPGAPAKQAAVHQTRRRAAPTRNSRHVHQQPEGHSREGVESHQSSRPPSRRTYRAPGLHPGPPSVNYAWG